jgi:hypothetical protein
MNQPELTFPSTSISGDTEATVSLVASDWRAEDDWRRFRFACAEAALNTEQTVDPNDVRRLLTNEYGLTIEPRRYSAFWHRAAGKRDGFLVADGWVVNEDHAGKNAGKPLRRYRLRT